MIGELSHQLSARNFEYDEDRYYLQLTVQMRKEFTLKRTNFFGEYEANRLLYDMNGTMLDMIPFNFAKYVLYSYDFDNLTSVFLDSLEILLGKSLCDIFVNRPRFVLKTINKQAKAQRCVSNRVIDNLIGDDPERRKKFLDVQLLRYHRNISQDFNYVSTI